MLSKNIHNNAKLGDALHVELTIHNCFWRRVVAIAPDIGRTFIRVGKADHLGDKAINPRAMGLRPRVFGILADLQSDK